MTQQRFKIILADAIIREANEEAGIEINKKNLELVHVMHRIFKNEDERMDFFFKCNEWNGEVTNVEPNKCDDLSWFEFNSFPENTLDYVKQAITLAKQNIQYSEFSE